MREVNIVLDVPTLLAVVESCEVEQEVVAKAVAHAMSEMPSQLQSAMMDSLAEAHCKQTAASSTAVGALAKDVFRSLTGTTHDPELEPENLLLDAVVIPGAEEPVTVKPSGPDLVQTSSCFECPFRTGVDTCRLNGEPTASESFPSHCPLQQGDVAVTLVANGQRIADLHTTPEETKKP